MNTPSLIRLLGVSLAGILLGGGILWGTASAETRVEGVLKGKTEWTKENSPYIVTGDIVVPEGSVLSVRPGVTVRFKANIADMKGTNSFDLELLVRGTLLTEGAESDTVIFTTDAETPRWTDWQGIVLKGDKAKADMRATIVEFCNEGIKCFGGTLKAKDVTVRRCQAFGINFIEGEGELDNVLVTSVGSVGGTGIGINLDRQSKATIKNSFIIGVQNGICFARGSDGRVDGCVVSMCASRGMIIRNSNPVVENCTITGNDYGMVVSAGAAPQVHKNNIFQNGTADLRLKDYKSKATKIDFSNNWWGYNALGLIEDRIADGIDDPNVKAFAIIEPFLKEAITSKK